MNLCESVGNTGSDIPLKLPCVDACPVCGAYLVTRGTNWLIRQGAFTAESLCAVDAEGRLKDAVLRWQCNRCGAKWVHGQFGGAA